MALPVDERLQKLVVPDGRKGRICTVKCVKAVSTSTRFQMCKAIVKIKNLLLLSEGDFFGMLIKGEE